MIGGGDRVKETSTGTGTGNLTLAGAVTGFVAFNPFFGLDICFSYWILHDTDNTWEHGIGHLSASTTLVRDSIIRSSNADAVVNFASGGLTIIASPGVVSLLGPRVDDHSVIAANINDFYAPGTRIGSGAVVEARVYYLAWAQRVWHPNGYDNGQTYHFSSPNQAVFRIALYTANPLTGFPKTKLWESSEGTIVGAAGQTVSLGATRKIIPGFYWMAVGYDDDGVNAFSSSVYRAPSGPLHNWHTGYGADPVPSAISTFRDSVNTYTRAGSMPATAGAVLNDLGAPHVKLELV